MAAKRPPSSTETLPSGATVEFWDEIGLDGLPQQRRYRVDGERLPSISTVSGSFDKPALMPAAVKLQEQAIIDLAASGVAIGKLTQPELRSKLRETGTHYDSQWAVARKRGDVAHDVLLRQFIRDGEVPDLAAFGDDQRNWIAAGMKFVLERCPEPLQVEYMVASTEHGFAGRADLAAIADDFLTAIDLKTVSRWYYEKDREGNVRIGPDGEPVKLPPWDENLLALAGYEIARVESGYIATDRRWIVRLGPDGEYDVYESTKDPEDFLAALRAYATKGRGASPVAESKARVAA
jgi:hypothetical protein